MSITFVAVCLIPDCAVCAYLEFPPNAVVGTAFQFQNLIALYTCDINIPM